MFSGFLSEKASLLGRFFSTLSLPACTGLAFVFLSWHFPLHISPWASWHSEALVFFGVFLAANWLVLKALFYKQTFGTVDIPFDAWPFMAFGAVAEFQYMTGLITYSGDVWIIGFYAALCVTSLSLGYACKQQTDRTIDLKENRNQIGFISNVSLLACVLALAGVCSSVLALAQSLDIWHSMTWIVRGYEMRSTGANLAQPNHLALLLVMATASLIYLRVERIVNSNTIFLLMYFVYCVGLALSASRAGLIGIFALLLWCLLGRRLLRFVLPLWFVVLMICMAVLAHVSWPPIFNSIFLTTPSPNTVVQSELRLIVWPQLLNALTLQPWAGWGMLQVAPAQNAVAHLYTISQAFTYSHNIILDALLWLGIPLGLASLATVLFYLSRCVYRAKTALDWYALAMILALLVSSQFEFQYAYAFFLTPVLFCWGASLARSMRTSNSKPLFSLSLKSTSILLLCTSAAMVFSAWEYFEQEQDIQLARLASVGVNRTLVVHEPPQTFMLNQLSELANSSRIKLTPELSAVQLQRLKNVALRYPWTATQYRYALALALRGDIVEAERQMLVMRAYYDHDLYVKVVEQLNVQLEKNNVNSKLAIRSR